MSEHDPSKDGTIVWTDLTVPNAAEVRDFYAAVAGWRPQPVSMGEYDDYAMLAPATETDTAVGGVCHARGSNAGMPPQWLIYVQVPDLGASVASAKQHGGSIVDGPRAMGGHQMAVVRDPAGAVFALIQATTEEGTQ